METSQQVANSEAKSLVVHCLTIPLNNEIAVLPNAAVAEVIGYKEATPIADAPEWFLGYMEWREKRVPLISFEIMSGKAVTASQKNTRIAVLNTLNGNADLPYIAIVTQGIPSLAILQEEGLEAVEVEVTEGSVISAIIKVGGVDALIPNIDEIEQRLIKISL
ncbi:MAG: chemotaxis protein CheW [Woeseiaceae bacterium]